VRKCAEKTTYYRNFFVFLSLDFDGDPPNATNGLQSMATHPNPRRRTRSIPPIMGKARRTHPYTSLVAPQRVQV
jgi:hypothetical protein